jgi:iron-sulfur cluster repair protein YtfE (RIC family)
MGLDLTTMHAVHGALRRELEQLARVAVSDDPRHVLRTAPGWQLFTRTLHSHHSAEDEVLWPALRRRLADRPDDLVALEALEAEHAALGEVVATIDALLADPPVDPFRLGDLLDSLVTGLRGHLCHEEEAAIPLITTVLTPQRWADFERVHHRRIGTALTHPLASRWNSRA